MWMPGCPATCNRIRSFRSRVRVTVIASWCAVTGANILVSAMHRYTATNIWGFGGFWSGRIMWQSRTASRLCVKVVSAYLRNWWPLMVLHSPMFTKSRYLFVELTKRTASLSSTDSTWLQTRRTLKCRVHLLTKLMTSHGCTLIDVHKITVLIRWTYKANRITKQYRQHLNTDSENIKMSCPPTYETDDLSWFYTHRCSQNHGTYSSNLQSEPHH